MKELRAWKIYVAILVFGFLPITLLGIYAYKISADTTESLIQQNNRDMARTAREQVRREFGHRLDTLRGFAGNPDFVELVKARNEGAVRNRLQVLVENHPRVVRAFVTAPDALLWSDYPRAPESLGKRFEQRDWYRGLSAGWHPYVSRVYRRHASPTPLLVAVAAPVKNEVGNIIGAVVYQVRLEGLTELLSQMVTEQGTYAVLLDPDGIVAAHPHIDVQARVYDEYANSPVMPANGNGVAKSIEYVDPISGDMVLATASPLRVSGNHWLVVAQRPLTGAYWLLAVQIGGAGLLLAILVVAFGFWLGRYHNRVLHLNTRLDELNAELQADNYERRRMYEVLLANLPGMAYRCRNDDDWTMEFVSDACMSLTGYSADALLHNRQISYRQIIHPEDRDRVQQDVERAVSRRRPFTSTYRIRTADDETKWVWEQGSAVHDDNGSVVALEGFITDVTEQKSLEKQLQQSQKMEAVGRLAGGVAHDFNNLLSVISGYSELILEQLPEGDPNKESLEEIRNAGSRAADLTRQLLSFSRKQVLKLEVLDLNEVIEGMSNMVRRLIGEDIELVLNLRESLEPVKFDPGYVEQIIMNLIVNARDTMPGGGKLTIETANVYLDEEYVHTHWECEAGPYAMIAISDTGHGMDAETQAHIFEPFFTTKSADKGTGLGLATVYGIVKQSGGHIWVYSEPGHGTTFKVYLPRVEGTASDIREGADVEQVEGTETILVVEDEDDVRQLVRHTLERVGYTVFDAGNAEEALDRCRELGRKLDLLLTDVVMPRIGGQQLAEQAIAILPGLKVVFMSGYTDDAIARYGVPDHDAVFIEKPITPTVLARKIREVLG